GFIAAIGWTGQGNAKISANDSSVSFKSKIEDTEFFLLPGEKIRTSSFVIMNYTGDLEAAQNKWRRFIRAEISIITKRGGKGPLCAGIWGGMTSEQVISRIDTLTNNSIPMEYMWMDAGWYGEDTQPTLSEYEGDWSQHTGDWTISPYIHKNRLVDVSEMIHKSGRRFILWFEPERICKRAPIVKQHPEYLLHNPARSDMLLNLGDENAFEYIKEQISSVIARVGVDFYRQDFNFEPLPYWRGADTEGRRGITEIKHITGLYRLWDYLLDRFPTLLIDNCASGGRRLDIETLKRSMPLWRSDAQCPANPIPEMTQMHTMNFAQWMPYHGSGTGRCYDTYNFRSAYAPSMTTNYTFSAADSFGDDEKKLEWLRKMANEYLTVREYFLGDVYHVTKPDISPYAWNIAQWNRPESFDGMIQVFKHESSVYPEAAFKLRALDEGKTYVIRDLDGGEQTATGKALMEEGIRVEIKETRVAKIYIYSALN
ncbi:MAG: alpha-galactosidase, partial [Clostridia bacterium]|nr:alpha-galactosidase [Clostridia bacterium]